MKRIAVAACLLTCAVSSTEAQVTQDSSANGDNSSATTTSSPLFVAITRALSTLTEPAQSAGNVTRESASRVLAFAQSLKGLSHTDQAALGLALSMLFKLEGVQGASTLQKVADYLDKGSKVPLSTLDAGAAALDGDWVEALRTVVSTAVSFFSPEIDYVKSGADYALRYGLTRSLSASRPDLSKEQVEQFADQELALIAKEFVGPGVLMTLASGLGALASDRPTRDSQAPLAQTQTSSLDDLLKRAPPQCSEIAKDVRGYKFAYDVDSGALRYATTMKDSQVIQSWASVVKNDLGLLNEGQKALEDCIRQSGGP